MGRPQIGRAQLSPRARTGGENGEREGEPSMRKAGCITLSPAPQLHIERTGAAVAHAGLCETRHDPSELGLLQPMRKIATQDAPSPPACKVSQAVGGLLAAALAGDHEHQPITPCVRIAKKAA